MKQYTTKVLCKGCKEELLIKFEAPKTFCLRVLPTKCTKCESDLEVHLQQGMMKRQLLTKVNMKKHTTKLLDILFERQVNA